MVEKLLVLPCDAQGVPIVGKEIKISGGADHNTIKAKVLACYKKAGSNTSQVKVLSANELSSVWTVDAERRLLYNAAGEEIPFKSEPAEEATAAPPTEDEPMASKRKKTTAKKRPAEKKKGGNGAGKPGVIATIHETIKRDRGASQEEILAVLTKKFPDRKAKSMASTIKIQAAKLAKKKDKDDKRGLVYYG